MDCACETVTYKKAIPSEIINKGDLIMIDLNTGLITRAVLEEPYTVRTNTTLVIGVCVYSDNDTPETIIVNGGKSKSTERLILNGGNASDIQTIIMNGGNSQQNTKEVIQVAYTGQHMVNLYNQTEIGDRLCISNQPGKAMSIDYLDYLDHGKARIRSIGKIIRYLNEEKTQAKVLLDIE